MDTQETFGGCVIKDGTDYKMWYSGHDDSNWRIFYASVPAIFENNGIFTSTYYDSGKNKNSWKTIKWEVGSLPTNTNIKLEVGTSDDNISYNYTTISTSSVIGINIASLENIPKSRYIKYRFTLTTTDTAVSPVINEVEITY